MQLEFKYKISHSYLIETFIEKAIVYMYVYVIFAQHARLLIYMKKTNFLWEILDTDRNICGQIWLKINLCDELLERVERYLS